MPEKFVIPAVGAIIEKEEKGKRYILMQRRKKKSDDVESGLWEIPAGKIREYENIYTALRREVKEETNLDITAIWDEEKCITADSIGYTVTDIHPFNITQNLRGGYSILVMVFLCRAEGEISSNAEENESVQWRDAEEVEKELKEFPERFYPMHLLTLKKYYKKSIK